MGEMSPDKGVFKRKGSDVWQHRQYVPKDVRHLYGGKEELPAKSLRTTDLGEANRRARLRVAEFEREFAAKKAARSATATIANTVGKRQLTNEIIERLAAAHHAAIVDSDFLERVATLSKAKAEPQAFWRGEIITPPKDTVMFRGAPYSYWQHLSEDFETPVETGVAYVLHKQRELRLEAVRAALRIGNSALLSDKADALLAGYEFDAPSRMRLLRRLMEAEISALGSIVEAEAPNFPALPTPAQSDNEEDPLLSQAKDAWLKEKEAIELTGRRVEDCEAAVKLFLEVISDKPMSSYTKGDVRRFKDILQRLPSNRSKIRETRNLGALAAAEEAGRLDLKRMSIKTINNKYLAVLYNLFEFALGNYDAVNRNPFVNASLPSRSSPRDEWDPFTPEALTAFFSGPLYTGCKSASKWLEQGTCIPRDSARFWLPLILLYTGCRVNEACKLKVQDVGDQDGVSFLHFEWAEDDDDAGIAGRVKNTTSDRRVPIHSDLISFGFLEFVSRTKSRGTERLFPELKPNRYGKLYGTISQRFSDTYLPGLGIKTEKTSLKSFRHNFVDAARNSRIPDPVVQALKGDTFEGTLARYGHGKTDLEILAEEIAKLRFRGLDLAHLAVAPSVVQPENEVSHSVP